MKTRRVALAVVGALELVVRDRTDKPAEGMNTVCYVNGFQSQPGEAEFWQNKHPDLILRDASGAPIVDANWPDEFLLDASTVTTRAALVEIIGDWITDTDVYSERVYDIEYFDDLAATVEETCASTDRPEHVIFRDRDLGTPNDPAYQLESC